MAVQLKRKDLRSGLVFLLPLDLPQTVLGLVTRIGNSGHKAAGPFFDVAGGFDMEALRSVIVKGTELTFKMFSTIGITEGHWPALGYLPGFVESDWPMPVYGHEGPGGYYERKYVEDGTLLQFVERPVSFETFERLPLDVTCGYLSLQDHIVHILKCRELEAALARKEDARDDGD